MFKRFLKFFKGDEHEVEESFSGSYLEHLLNQVKPFVELELRECPDHDPELLAIVGIFRGTMLDRWSSEIRRPLVDSQTPGVTPPPPPVETEDFLEETKDFEVPERVGAKRSALSAGDSPGTEDSEEELPEEEKSEESSDADKTLTDEDFEEESDSSNEEESDSSAEDESDSSEEADSEDDEEEEEEEAQGRTSSDDSTTIDELDIVSEEAEEAGGGSYSRITEEIDISEIQAAATEANDEAPDTTLEMDRNELKRGSQPRVDAPKVLQAGRMFLQMLLDNDRMPDDLQLNVGEIVLARDLLLGYFVGSSDFDSRAKQLLALVEKKFSDGLFTQAQILLQLFHTDEATRVNNDRNLFYEDMILRLGIRRRHKLTEEDLSTFQDMLKEADNDDGFRVLAHWLNHRSLIKFHLCLVDPAQAKGWSELLEPCALKAASAEMLEHVPPSRWRTVDAFSDIPVKEQIRRHATEDAARRYVISQLSTCYFILRAVGDTGLEGYLDNFFDWSEKNFDLNATLLMPILYNRSMQETLPMTEILNEIYEEYFDAGVKKLVDEFDDQRLDAATKAAIKKLGKCDLGEIAPGYYDLGGFVFDQLFEMEYPSVEFGSKIHRIT